MAMEFKNPLKVQHFGIFSNLNCTLFLFKIAPRKPFRINVALEANLLLSFALNTIWNIEIP